MMPGDCPPEDVLSRYATGELPEGDAQAIDTHVGRCTVCLRRLDGLAGRTDPLVAALRRPGGPAAGEPPALAQAVAAVLAGGAPAPPPGPGPGSVLGGYRLLDEIGRG